jgi:hypothetical protein
MDLKGYSQETYDSIEAEYRKFLASVGVEPLQFIPIAAKHGDNIASISANMPWWKGPTVIEMLDRFQLAGLALLCLKNETKAGAEKDLRELISASGEDAGEKARRERLLHHLQSTDEAEPLELAKYSLRRAHIGSPELGS